MHFNRLSLIDYVFDQSIKNTNKSSAHERLGFQIKSASKQTVLELSLYLRRQEQSINKFLVIFFIYNRKRKKGSIYYISILFQPGKKSIIVQNSEKFSSQ